MEGKIESKKKLGRPQSKELMIERHKQMLELQKKIFPFTPTLRELESVWYSKNTGNLVSSARSMLLNMKQECLVVTMQKN